MVLGDNFADIWTNNLMINTIVYNGEGDKGEVLINQ